MGPEKICRIFKKKNPDVDKFKVILYGSLALTGRGHGTDRIVKETLSPIDTTVEFDFEKPTFRIQILWSFLPIRMISFATVCSPAA